MPDSKNQPSDSQGVLGQMSRLKHHSNATADELRQFIHSMKGKSPHQMLGMIAQSDLIRSTAVAAVLFAVLLVLFTALPAMMSGGEEKAVAAAPVKQEQNDEKKTKVKPDTKTATTKNDAKDGKATAVIPDKNTDILNSLDIGDSKNSDPKKNPLDGFDPFENVKE